MSKPLTGIQANILKLWKADNTICDDDNRLTATYWLVFDKLDYSEHTNPYEMLKAVTPVDSIKRARRILHEFSHITYSKKTEDDREEQYKEHTEQYSNADSFAAMRARVKEGKL